MSKYICVSDFHIDIWEKNSQPNKDVNTRFHHQRVILDEIYNLAKKEKATVIFNGDIFNSRKNIDIRCINMFTEELLKHKDIPVIFNVGNHDQVDNSSHPDHSLEIYKLLGYSVFDHVGSLTIGNDHLVFVPYSEDIKYLKDNLAKEVEVLDLAKHNLLFAHIGVAGSKNGKWLHRLDGAFAVGELYSDKFQFVALGHYHMRQMLADNVFYAGDTIPLNGNDEGLEKGVYLIDTEKGNAKFVPLKSPKFITVDLANTKLSAEEIKEIARDNFVKVISTNAEDTKKYSDNNLQVVQEVNTEFKPRLGLSVNDSTKEIVEKYATEKYDDKVKDKSLDILGKVSGNS